MRRRRRSDSVLGRDGALMGRIRPIKAEHPCWGYRRTWAYLRYREGIVVGRNRVYRLLRENNLLAVDTRRLRATRVPGRSKPRATEPNRLWGIDMTKICVESWGWLYLVVVLDWASKKIVGWDLATTSKTADWLRALCAAVNGQFPEGIRERAHLQLVSDNGCQPTPASFMASVRNG
ncbi:MAG TPA: IS3 family transposase [Verrucomicrobiae bacterium]|nr:IS3 family transposase [Verrucomicrobiae bacterium]